MFRNKLILPCMLLPSLFLSGLPLSVQARDLSTVQTALRIAQDEMNAAKTVRDADAQRLAKTEKDMERIRVQLAEDRKKAAESEKRYLESSKQYDKAKAAFNQAWKR